MKRIVNTLPDDPDFYFLTEEEEDQIAKEEYRMTHWTCEVCGGEIGDGWSTCRCDDDESYDPRDFPTVTDGMRGRA